MRGRLRSSMVILSQYPLISAGNNYVLLNRNHKYLISRNVIMETIAVVSFNPFRSRPTHTDQPASISAGGCNCKRCTCPHAVELHSVRKDLSGHDHVFCSACDDICLTHTLPSLSQSRNPNFSPWSPLVHILYSISYRYIFYFVFCML